MADENLVTTESRRYKTLVTDVGKEKIANAVLSGEKVKITKAAVGDGGGTYYMPTADMTSLKREVWRGDIAAYTVNPKSRNMLDIKIFLDGDVGGFTVREIGLFDEDGDMIAICNTPDTEKAVLVDGIAATLTVLMHVVFTDVDVVEFHVDPSVDVVSTEDLQNAIQAHNEDPNAHRAEIAEAVTEKVAELEESGELVTPEKVEEVVTEEIKKHPTGGYYGSYAVTLPADGWEAVQEENPDYSFVCDVAIADAKSDFVPSGGCNPGYFDIAGRAEIVNGCTVFDGYVRFYAKRVPEADVEATVILFSRGAGGGGVRGIGAGLEYDGEGNVAVKAGEGISFDENGGVTVDRQEVVTENDMLDEDETEESVKNILLNGVSADESGN